MLLIYEEYKEKTNKVTFFQKNGDFGIKLFIILLSCRSREINR